MSINFCIYIKLFRQFNYIFPQQWEGWGRQATLSINYCIDLQYLKLFCQFKYSAYVFRSSGRDLEAGSYAMHLFTRFCILGTQHYMKLFCRIAEHGSLVLQIVHFPFSIPVVYRLHPLHVLDCACSTSMQQFTRSTITNLSNIQDRLAHGV